MLLILAGVAIVTLTGDNGILTQAGKAKTKNKNAKIEEQVKLAFLGSYGTDGKTDYSDLQTNLKNIEGMTGIPDTITEGSFPLSVTLDGEKIKIFDDGTIFNSGEWDETATPEDCFYWASEDPNDEGYGTVIGYTAKIENYTKLKYPSRCAKINFEWSVKDYYGVTMATSRAFTNNIIEVEMPDTVTSIGYSAFGSMETQSFKSLKKVLIGCRTGSIGSDAFVYCESLTSVDIPNSVTSIGDRAFSRCTSLSSIEIPSSVTSIESYAFDNTMWYNNQPDGLVYAGKVAYKYKGTMPSNTSITIRNGVSGIAGGAFYECTGLSGITIPDSVTCIGSNAFRGCTSLSSIEIPSSVTSIGDDALRGCTSLSSIEIPSSVTSIGSNAFYDCTSLSSIEIPSSVTSIGNGAFYNTMWYNNKPNGVVYVGKIAYKYKGTMPSNTSIQIKEGTTDIGEYAFSNCRSLSNIIIPDSVKNICDGAFSDCTGLSSITIPNSVTSIGNSAFSYCTSLSSIKIPGSVTNMGVNVFYAWNSFQTINIQGYTSAPAGWSKYWLSGCSAQINWNQ